MLVSNTSNDHLGSKRKRDESGLNDFTPPSKKICVEDAVQYIEQIKRTFMGAKEDVYFEFLRLMALFREGRLDVSSICKRIRILFKGYDHLINGFNIFLPEDYVMQSEDTSGSANGESGQYFRQAIEFIDNIRQRFLDEPSVYEKFLEILHLYKEQVLELSGVYSKVRNLIGDHEDLWNQFVQYLPPQNQVKVRKEGEPDENIEILEDEDEITAKSQTNKFKWRYGPQYDGPSYEMISEDVPKPSCSQRTQLENEVLNDDLICVGSRHSKWNQNILLSEKTTGEYWYLKQVEDAMIELETTLDVSKKFVDFLAEIQKRIEADETVTISKEDLTQSYRGLLRHIYASKKSKIIKALRSNPKSTVPVVLTRFRALLQSWEKQKLDSLVNVRAAQEVAYWESFRRNLNAFKVSETKTLSEKQILEDALEHYKLRTPYQSSLGFACVHKDIFKLMISQTQLPKEKVKEFWKSFVIPFFNLHKKELDVGNVKKTSFDQICELPKARSVARHRRKNSHLITFYGNATIMIFLRFYILMYDRLLLARKAAPQKRAIDIRRQEIKLNYATSDNSGPGLSFVSSDGEQLDTSSHYEQPILYPFQTTEIVADYYDRFMELLQNILGEQIEQQTFEEELMKYVGFDSYKLFTIVHLFERMEAKLFDCINTPRCQSLISSFNYELNRTNPFQDDAYFKNVNQILTFTEDIYEVHYSKVTRICRIQKTDNVIRHHPLERWTTQGFTFLKDYIDSNQNSEKMSDIRNKTLKVFLNRNKTRAKRFFKNRQRNPTDNTAIFNGTECYLCLITMRLRFKEGTSDIFVRSKVDSKPKVEEIQASS